MAVINYVPWLGNKSIKCMPKNNCLVAQWLSMLLCVQTQGQVFNS